MQLPELLAPAGSFDAALAAFAYGADAIYLGLSRFSARADAANFSDEELAQIVAYARNLERPRKVYVTLNTLIETHEFEALIPSLSLLEKLSIDGVIVQDLGLAARIHRQFPSIPLHASTQLACTSLAGARALKAMGFVRIVTARELTLAEAAEIGRKADVEIEVFVHGALCYSISGLCLFSSLTTGRSGNRGRCAYCCRQAFREVSSKTGEVSTCHPFSMRDLALIDCGEALRTLPLASLKIEGRMKNPLYVAAVTDLYRTLLDGKLTPALRAKKTEDLRTIFSRPWTTLYATDLKTPVEAIIDPLC
ncbi:MAG: U32 family peptidase, partial [Kiritimatiellae bacterium]|nr:U32 family peptidase [Kiritimatiellia bacterium]